MNYLSSVTYIFEDKDWVKKMGLAAVLQVLTPTIIGWIAFDGWCVEVFRRAADDADEELPGWEHWRAYLHDGLKYLGVEAVWMFSTLLIDVIVGWPSWIIVIPSSILLVGALIIVARTGSFRRAVNPVNAWKALRPYGVAGLVVVAALSAVNELWAKPMADLILSSHFWRDVAASYLLAVVLSLWYSVITCNLFGRLYRQCSTEV